MHIIPFHFINLLYILNIILFQVIMCLSNPMISNSLTLTPLPLTFLRKLRVCGWLVAQAGQFLYSMYDTTSISKYRFSIAYYIYCKCSVLVLR